MSGRKVKELRKSLNISNQNRRLNTDIQPSLWKRLKIAWYVLCGVRPSIRKRLDFGGRYRRLKKILRRKK